MRKKAAYLIVLVIAIPLILYFIFPSDESRLKELFKEGSKAVEREDLDSVMSKVSFHYRDDYGLTYLYLKESMKTVFNQMRDIKIEYENVTLSVEEKTATADMDVWVIATIGSDTGYVMGDLPNPVHLKFTLEKERTKWLITKTEGLPSWW
jgi:hypothetical protein